MPDVPDVSDVSDVPDGTLPEVDALPKRCVRRQSRPLNAGKAEALAVLVNAYAKEKDDHLVTLTPDVARDSGATE
ncbi:MAG: hypothetical protein M1522_01665 [Actinobacteria bacterium]|nr:hypothetical protein [Actinomycetota bacterium]